MKLKLIFLLVIMGFALNGFSDDISKVIVCAGDSCEQETCVVKQLASQWHGPSKSAISDFGPAHEVGYYINVNIVNNSRYGKIIFAHDFNSKANIDFNVFEFGPGCSQQVKFKSSSKQIFKHYFYEVMSHDAKKSLEMNFWKGIEGSMTLSTHESDFLSRDKMIDLGDGKGHVCSKAEGSYDDKSETYSLSVVLEDC